MGAGQSRARAGGMQLQGAQPGARNPGPRRPPGGFCPSNGLLLLWVGQGAGRGSSGCQPPARPLRGRSLGSPGRRGGERRPRERLNAQPLARALQPWLCGRQEHCAALRDALLRTWARGDSDSAPAGSRGSLWCRSGCPTDTQMQRRDLTAAGPSANKAGLALVILGSTV